MTGSPGVYRDGNGLERGAIVAHDQGADLVTIQVFGHPTLTGAAALIENVPVANETDGAFWPQ